LAEGYLYPGNYSFKPHTTPLQMLQAMVARFKSETASLNLVSAARKAGFTPVQLITEASILYAEVSNQPKYYPDVARVIDNRLNQGGTLNLDSTIEYGLGIHGFNMTVTQLHEDTPYNTNLHDGLPPGPIYSPDVAAIEAVLHPTPKTPTTEGWIYFVTINKAGVTKFTSSKAQFDIWSKEAARNGV
ncbi:MAG: endolytic transglycosylase MltG, partial [Streptosporangiaceae bacterium]